MIPNMIGLKKIEVFFKWQLWVTQELWETNFTTGIRMVPRATAFTFMWELGVWDEYYQIYVQFYVILIFIENVCMSVN